MANTFDKIDEDQNNDEKVLEIILHVGSLANIRSARQFADRLRFLLHVSKKNIRDCFSRFFDGNRAASRRAYMAFTMKGDPLLDQDHISRYCSAIHCTENE